MPTSLDPGHDQVNDQSLPANLRPSWRDTPALAWTLACAYAGGPVLLRPFGAVMTAPMLWFPVLAGYHVRGGVVRRSRHAVLLLASRTPEQARVSRLLTIRLVAVTFALFIALPVAGATAEFILTGRSGSPVTRAALFVAFLMLGAGILPQLRAIPRIRELNRVRRSGLLPGWEEAVRGDMFAAWPQGRGHGTALLTELHDQLPAVGPVMALARDQRVAALYARFGLHPVTPGSLILARPTDKNTQRHLVHEEPDGGSSSNTRS